MVTVSRVLTTDNSMSATIHIIMSATAPPGEALGVRVENRTLHRERDNRIRARVRDLLSLSRHHLFRAWGVHPACLQRTVAEVSAFVLYLIRR